MDNKRDTLYNFIVDHFKIGDYERAIEQDEEPEVKDSFTNHLPTYEQFKLKQREEVDSLSEEDLAGAIWLMTQIRTGSINMVDKEAMHNAWDPDGFYYLYGCLILTHPR
jgi:hypothetical protein